MNLSLWTLWICSFPQEQAFPLGRGFLVSLADTEGWIYNGDLCLNFFFFTQYLVSWELLLRMKFSHAHFMSHKKSLHLSKFLFSFVLDCDRMGRDRFSPVKRMTLLLLLVMPSTRELIPCSYTVLPTQGSRSSPGLQPKRSEGEMSCWNLFVRSVVILSIELSSSASSTCVVSAEVSTMRPNHKCCAI